MSHECGSGRPGIAITTEQLMQSQKQFILVLPILTFAACNEFERVKRVAYVLARVKAISTLLPVGPSHADIEVLAHSGPRHQYAPASRAITETAEFFFIITALAVRDEAIARPADNVSTVGGREVVIPTVHHRSLQSMHD